MRATPLRSGPARETLIPQNTSAEFFEPQVTACTYEGGCLATQPPAGIPPGLARIPSSWRAQSAAREMLPPEARWLLSARTAKGQPVTATVVLPPAIQLGDIARADAGPFSLLSRGGQLHVGVMFLIGAGLLFCSAALGLVVKGPQEPLLPQAEPWIPDAKVLPRIVTSPQGALPVHYQP